MKIRYFAWMRERVGFDEERYQPKAETLGGLVDELIARGENYAAAFSERAAIRGAIDEELAELDASIVGAEEVAFFPPVTGG